MSTPHLKRLPYYYMRRSLLLRADLGALCVQQANFTDGERGGGADWLGRHQASLFGTVGGNQSVVALSLSSAPQPRAAAFARKSMQRDPR